MVILSKTTSALQPYQWEESDEAIAGKYGLKPDQVVRFDMNTNPYLPEAVGKAAKTLDFNLNEYPMPSYERLVGAIASYACVASGQIVVGAGGDEVIDVIAKTFLDPGNRSVISTPTYSMFKVCSQLRGARVVEVPRGKWFGLDVGALAEAAKDAKMLWVCNPNSPTGNAATVDELLELVESVGCVVVVDEAYVEFWGESIVGEVAKYPNLIAVRTLSKAFGLAGARVGYAVTNAELAEALNRTRPPCSISSISEALAIAALGEEGVTQAEENMRKIKENRENLKQQLEALGLDVFPSVANFLLVGFEGYDAYWVYKRLISMGLVTRNFSGSALTPNCLRVTVRTEEENNLLVEAIGGALR
ncbi:histidinol-phosphate transaminase [Candidatus Micrarchaeota archaeon]|nr:histidinol-phosphate transaminase [Candidatus Micrarchaeota archaeon]